MSFADISCPSNRYNERRLSVNYVRRFVQQGTDFKDGASKDVISWFFSGGDELKRKAIRRYSEDFEK